MKRAARWLASRFEDLRSVLKQPVDSGSNAFMAESLLHELTSLPPSLASAVHARAVFEGGTYINAPGARL